MPTLREYQRRKKALAESQGALIASDLDALTRSLRLFMTNCDELLTLLGSARDQATALQLWALENRAGFERFLDEVERLFHNVVAAAASLKNHSMRIRDKWIKADPPDGIREEHDARVREVFAESETAQLVEGLRNIVQHKKLPRLLGYAAGAPGEPFNSRIVFDTEDLLRWDRWSPSMRSFLEGSDDPVALDELVVHYRDAVREFHGWFGSAVARRNFRAMTRLEQDRRDLATYAAGLFGPPLSNV